MSARPFDPLRLDVAAFAKVAAELEGRWPVRGFARIAELVLLGPAEGLADTAEGLVGPGADLETARGTARQHVGIGAHHNVTWRARGERRSLRSGEPQTWLHLDASAAMPLQCQRCLEPVIVPIEVHRNFQFVHGEEAAAQLDADSEDDVLALTHALDLHELLEDELLLALPLVPRHEHCAQSLAAPAVEDHPAASDEPHPFAGLAVLKRGKLN